MEEWKGLKYKGIDYSDYYAVSSYGNIKSNKTGIVRKLHIGKTGYYVVALTFGSRCSKKTIRVHRAVAESFIQNPDKKETINHIDGNKLNNNVENLEWCTYKENSVHAVENNLIKSGAQSHKAKLKNADVFYIRHMYENHKDVYSIKKLSEMFGVNKEAIRRVIKRESFKNI